MSSLLKKIKGLSIHDFWVNASEKALGKLWQAHHHCRNSNFRAIMAFQNKPPHKARKLDPTYLRPRQVAKGAYTKQWTVFYPPY